MVGDDWISDVLSEVSHVETPKSWLWWSLVGAISAAAGNNYYLRTLKGALVYKPNLYIMLLGDSGLGKGFGINLSKLLVQKAEVTRVIAGRSSIQAIVSELAKTKTNANGKPPIQDSRGYIVNGELSSAIIADVDSLSILTDLYDGHYNPEWTNLLKTSGAEKLKEPYVTALFGSSPAHFYDSIPQANIEGGYIGRNLVVYEEKRSQNVDLLDDDGDKIDDKLKDHIIPEYAKHLVQIYEHKGRLLPTNSSRELFNSWRRQWREKQTHDKTGFLNRVPDHVLKVSMCLSLARYNSAGVISEDDVQTAIEAVTKLIYSSKLTTEGRGLDPLAAQTKMVLDYLIRAPDNILKRKELLNKGYGNFDTISLDKILENLVELGWIKKERLSAGKASDWIIHLSGEPLVKYQEWRSKQ